MSIIILKVILVFSLTLAVDFSWSAYIKLVSQNKTGKAALWAAFIHLAGGVAVITYTENNWMLIPIVIGGSIGTYLSKYFK